MLLELGKADNSCACDCMHVWCGEGFTGSTHKESGQKYGPGGEFTVLVSNPHGIMTLAFKGATALDETTSLLLSPDSFRFSYYLFPVFIVSCMYSIYAFQHISS